VIASLFDAGGQFSPPCRKGVVAPSICRRPFAVVGEQAVDPLVQVLGEMKAEFDGQLEGGARLRSRGQLSPLAPVGAEERVEHRLRGMYRP
jgi:hypothetical protein